MIYSGNTVHTNNKLKKIKRKLKNKKENIKLYYLKDKQNKTNRNLNNHHRIPQMHSYVIILLYLNQEYQLQIIIHQF